MVRLPASGAETGALRLFNAFGDTHLLVDVVGYFTTTAPAARTTAEDPHRLLDTRLAGAALGPGGTRTFSTGMPGATAVVLNLTAVDATAAGYLTAYASDATRPGTSNLNVRPGEAIPNLVIVHPAPDGTVRVYNSAGSTHLVVDIVARLD